MIDTKVIGYLAYFEKEQPVCSGDACIVAGSEKNLLEDSIDLISGESSLLRFRKVRFRDIIDGMSRGGAYAIDKESYKRFYPLAKQKGFPVKDIDFKEAEEQGKKYLSVRLT